MRLRGYAFVLMCAAGTLVLPKPALAQEPEAVSQWLYSSYSFGTDSEDDTVIGGMRLYGSEDLEASDSGYIAPTARNDASYLRTEKDKRPCAAIVEHYCPLRPEGRKNVEGYLYFDAGKGFGTGDRELTFEIEYFDDRTEPFKLKYVNSENSLAMAEILCEGSGKWRTARVSVNDAYFNMEGTTILGDGSCDFRIEANGAMARIGRVALYNYADSQSGRSYKSIAVNGKRTDRPYFTQSMWSADSKKLLLRSSDGWVYAYDVANDSVQKIVNCSADFYVSAGNYLYYVNTASKTINRINLDNNKEEILTAYPPGAAVNPNYIHVNNSDTRLSVMFAEDSSPLDREIGEGGTYERRNRRIPVYDIVSGEWDLRYTHEFPAGTPHMTHLMLNPVYDKLVFFCHEGTTTKVPDRMWTINLKTGKKKNIFVQEDNSLGAESAVRTGETSGHENWTADGEHMVFVKYPYATNVGMSGIVRVDKYGGQREYINNDYQYWHCHPSVDNRFIVGDTMIRGSSAGSVVNMNFGSSEIVLVDAKLSGATLLAGIKAGTVHPYQPHPSFSPNGKLVCFARVDENELLCVGIMDITDITAHQEGEVFCANTNEDKGALISEIAVSEDTASIAVQGTQDDTKIRFYRGDFDSQGKLVSADISEAELDEGESDIMTVSGVSEDSRFFVWNDSDAPLSAEPSAPEALRAADIKDCELKLYWRQPTNLIPRGVKYEVYRNGELTTVVEDGYFRDVTVSENTKYEYKVRAVYPGGTVSPYARLEVETTPAVMTNILCEPQYGKNDINFLDNTASPAADSYTERAYIKGRECRKSTQQLVNGRTKTGKFYFAVSGISPNDAKVEITAEYLDIGSAPIYIEYNAADGSVAKRVQLAKRGNTGEWVSATVAVQDAEFIKAQALSNCDFRVEGGADTYLYSVSVKNISPKPKTAAQSAYCNLADSSKSNALTVYSEQTGDSRYEMTQRGGRACAYSPAGKNLYFDVKEEFLYGAAPRGIEISFEYFDEGSSDIYIQYNTNDPTYSGNKAYKRKLVTTCGDSLKWKTAKIMLIDADFRNLQDEPYRTDFRLYSSGGLSVSDVKISAAVR